MNKTYHGACHCGAVRYSAALDLDNGTSRCNCSICSKTQLWKAETDKGSFRLLQGDDGLTEYRFNTCTVQHKFCGTCGVKVFGRGVHDGEAFIVISVATLEGVRRSALRSERHLSERPRLVFGRTPADHQLSLRMEKQNELR